MLNTEGKDVTLHCVTILEVERLRIGFDIQDRFCRRFFLILNMILIIYNMSGKYSKHLCFTRLAISNHTSTSIIYIIIRNRNDPHFGRV